LCSGITLASEGMGGLAVVWTESDGTKEQEQAGWLDWWVLGRAALVGARSVQEVVVIALPETSQTARTTKTEVPR